MADSPGLAAIKRAAKENGIAWQPVAAIDYRESGLRPNAVGDKGTSFGLAQLHRGGALPANISDEQAMDADWNAGFQARAIKALNIQHLPYYQQTYQISKRFERPTDVKGETKAANDYLRKLGPQGLASRLATAPAAAPTLQPSIAQTTPLVSLPGLPAAAIAALQSSAYASQDQSQRALSALGKISGSSRQAPAARDFSQLLAQAQAASLVPTMAATPLKLTSAKPTSSTTGLPPGIGKNLRPGGGGFIDPLPAGDKVTQLGKPYQGTHGKTFNQKGGSDNWESENAIDLGTHVGTPVYAVADGTIGNSIGSLGSGGRFAGLRVHLNVKGNELYYAHLSKLTVKAGQKVTKGQIIGYTGSANGVAHLHLAAKNGDPAQYFDY